MYLTEISRALTQNKDNFDWESYFSVETNEDIVKSVDPAHIFAALRKHLKEDPVLLVFTLNRLMKKLMQGVTLKSPRILELGAATGVLTRYLLNQFGGQGVLVDKSPASFDAYTRMQDSLKDKITYVQQDLFQLDLQERFDIVCSFGLIEHFKEKQAVVEAHRKFVAPGGYALILVPLDSPLTRAFLEVHPELNLGYRELLKEKELKKILKDNRLQVVNIASSWGYCYDFAGALCRVEESKS